MRNFFKKKHEKVVIFGTGVGGRNFFQQHCHRFDVVAFADNNPEKQGTQLFGKRVINAEQIKGLCVDKVVIASDYHVAIYEQLVGDLHYPAENIYLFHDFNVSRSLWLRVKLYFQSKIYQAACSENPVLSKLTFALFFFNTAGGVSLKLVSVCWLDQYQEGVCAILKRPGKVRITGPSSANAVACQREVERPAISLNHFQNGMISSISRSVVLPDHTIVLERVISADIVKADYSGGHVVYHSAYRALVNVSAEPVQLAEGILVNGVNETNYYHWLLETLSQIYYLKQLPADFDRVPLLLSGYAKKIPAVTALLKAFQLNREIIYLDNTVNYDVSSLFLINSPCLFVTHSKFSAACQLEDYYADEEALLFLREAGLSCVSSDDMMFTPKKIFLARKQSLRAYNQSEVSQLLARYDFEEVYLEDLSFSQQVALINNAEYIVGPTGAAWSNLLFASRNCRALCWMPSEFGDFACFSHLAACFDVKLDYIRYDTGEHDSRSLYYRRYNIETSLIKNWLELYH